MVRQAGKAQAAFTAGEIDESLWDRNELKYRQNGLKFAENVVFAPQGGLTARDGQRDVGALSADAARLLPFKSSAGLSYDVVIRPAEAEAWSATAKLDTFALTGLTSVMLPDLSFAQSSDTALLFHADLPSLRIKHVAANDWQVDAVPYGNLPNYDYGGPVGGGAYTNGVAAVWQLEFDGFTDGNDLFNLSVLGVTTPSLAYNATTATLASTIQTALLALSNIGTGLTATSPAANKIDVTFAGADNIIYGDGWAIGGSAVNNLGIIYSYKTTQGTAPGEPVISTDRGWPACGAFIDQRLFVGGFKPLRNAYMYSVQADYYNFDTNIDDASGGQLVPMNLESGEAIVQIVDDRNPVILTNEAEYWLTSRAVSALEIPNHVQASRNGSVAGIPIAPSEGAMLYTEGGVLRELRFTDVNGNYLSDDISLLASHLFVDVTSMAVKRSRIATAGNHLVAITSAGAARLASILRVQEVTAFGRLTTKQGLYKAVAVNGRNEISMIVARPSGRRLERFESGLLLDEAVSFTNGAPSAALSVDARFNARQIWVIADNEVFGPFTVSGGAVTLPVAVSAGYYGTWMPPLIETLHLQDMVGEKTEITGPNRIHTVHLHLKDTTSIALGANGGPLYDLALGQMGMVSDTPELLAGYSGRFTVSGLEGFVDYPTVRISQVRPGRLQLLSLTMEAVF